MEKAQKQSPGTSFRRFLQEELLRRCRKNPGYSLRSFAKALQINPASLSRILRGERKISQAMMKRLSGLLDLSPESIAEFSFNEEGGFNQLSLDAFAVISDWYHYAILELVQLDDFEAKPQWVAKTLGLTVHEVNTAVERLQRLNMLEIEIDGTWVNKSGNNSNIDEELKDPAQRSLQKQVLKMALQALEEIPVEKRSQTSMTMAIDTDLLLEAIDKIKSFRRHLSSHLESGSKKDAVYQLSISLYPLTKK